MNMVVEYMIKWLVFSFIDMFFLDVIEVNKFYDMVFLEYELDIKKVWVDNEIVVMIYYEKVCMEFIL